MTALGKDDGQSMLLFVMLLPILLGTAGLGVSLGMVYFQQGRLQNAVDAAALAGAKAASQGQSPNSQSSIILLDAPSAINPTVNLDPTNPLNVVAQAHQQVSGGFAALFGFQHITIYARAVARYGPGEQFNYAVFQGSKNRTNPMVFNGNDNIHGSQPGVVASVHSNGDILINGSVRITGVASADGNVQTNGNNQIGEIQDNQPFISTPDWPIPSLPSTSGWQVVQSLPQNTTLTGNYLVQQDTLSVQNDTIYGSIMAINGASIQLNGTSTMYGNLYTVGGGNISLNGSNTVNGNILATQNGTGTPSQITLNGGSTISGFIVSQGGSIFLNGNDSSGSGSGLTVGAFAENGVGGNITVNGGVSLTGVLYAPDGNLIFNGNDTVTGAAVAHQVTLNGSIDVAYNPSVVQAVPFQSIALIQ